MNIQPPALLDDRLLAVIGQDPEIHHQLADRDRSLGQELVFAGLRRSIGGREVVTRARAPLKLDDAQLKRAGMDYWQHVEWHLWPDWKAFEAQALLRSNGAESTLWFIESGGPKLYSEARFAPEDYLVFGRETAGLPKQLLEQHRERWLRIPMFNAESRSLNLSNCAALILFEALRQQGFGGET